MKIKTREATKEERVGAIRLGEAQKTQTKVEYISGLVAGGKLGPKKRSVESELLSTLVTALTNVHMVIEDINSGGSADVFRPVLEQDIARLKLCASERG